MDLVWFHWGDKISGSVLAAESALMALVCFEASIK